MVISPRQCNTGRCAPPRGSIHTKLTLTAHTRREIYQRHLLAEMQNAHLSKRLLSQIFFNVICILVSINLLIKQIDQTREIQKVKLFLQGGCRKTKESPVRYFCFWQNSFKTSVLWAQTGFCDRRITISVPDVGVNCLDI